MKKLLILNVLMMSAGLVMSQCSVTIKDLDGTKIYRAKFEVIYKNEDLENGLKVIRLSTYYIKKGNDTALFMDILYAKSSYQPLIVPRKVILLLANGKTIDIVADKNDTPDLGVKGLSAEQCTFNISLDVVDMLSKSSISSITVFDYRTGQSVIAEPFKFLLQEQIGCVIKASM